MAYFLASQNMICLYNDYKKIMDDRIIIGVKAGTNDGTPLNEVEKLCLWNDNKKGMMLWTFNRDTPQYTLQDVNKWSETINQNLNLNFLFKTIKYMEFKLS